MKFEKTTYTCANCGWTASLHKNWADLKPKRCGNKRCKTSFQKNPDLLVIEIPETQKQEVTVKEVKEKKQSKSKKELLEERSQKEKDNKSEPKSIDRSSRSSKIEQPKEEEEEI